MAIKVALLEDDRAYREMLEVLLNGTPGFRCVCSHATAEEALKDRATHKAEVALVDISLPGMSGIEYVRRLRISAPEVHPMMLTIFEDTERLFQSLTAGAYGYMLKRTAPAEILQAIREVTDGGAPLSRSIARRVIQHFHTIRGPAQELTLLTSRERQVLDELASGYSYKEIAEKLALSLETVKAHLRNVYKKLHVSSRTEAVVKALGHSPPGLG